MGANLTLLKKEAITHAEIDVLASVHPDAVIGEGCKVGAYAVIGPGVTLGRQCVVHPHGVVMGPTLLGDGNEVHPFACIGGAPQDLRHRGEPTELVIGHRNSFREHVTVGRGTVHGGGRTVIGDDNLVMAYCHIAHDCIIGNRVVMANGATLAGHVQVQDFAVFGGMVAVASFVRIGESAMLAAGAMLEKDVPPFAMVAGNRAVLKGVNRVGIARRDFSGAARLEIKRIIRALKKRETPLSNIMESFRNSGIKTPEALRLFAFLEQLPRGVTR
ncbi:MAG: acyl-ACP--UDP-N-acetylglucosamine O-acyltransferase [Deltaproteobacteria bacterium]|nr:acyl-ACP--UDP-N-acetylglucosamine O-acyltransferase [Deltaproteobacteria bacterium]